jgi:hypothetical protein
MSFDLSMHIPVKITINDRVALNPSGSDFFYLGATGYADYFTRNTSIID